jgi:hypothetical protein
MPVGWPEQGRFRVAELFSQFANLEARCVVGDPAAVDDQLGVALWYELGCGVDAYGASPKALADRVTASAVRMEQPFRRSTARLLLKA